MALQTKKLYVATDHTAIEFRQFLIEQIQLIFPQLEIIDFGPDKHESVDYPDQAFQIAKALKTDKEAFGLLICGTGIGISIAANRYDWIRAALIHTSYEAEITRKHNNSNVIVFGARTLGVENALHALKFFLEAEFEGGRHERRVNKLIHRAMD